MFDQDIKQLKIAENRLNLLYALNIYTIDDLIHYYPYRYDVIEETPLVPNESFVIEAMVIDEPRVFYIRKNLTRMSFHIKYNNQEILVTIFNRHFLRSHLKMHSIITIMGRCEQNIHSIVASDIKCKPLDEVKGIYPVYSLKTGLTNKAMQGYIKKALKLVHNDLIDFIPEEYIQKYNLIYLREALQEIHFPTSKEMLKQALRYLKYEEFLEFQCTMLYIKKTNTDVAVGVQKKYDQSLLNEFIFRLPFHLTADQQKVTKEILQDLTSTRIMDRLIQGDVGSGKTVVAGIAMYATCLSGYQCALMAPTEILARQHYHTMQGLFAHTDIRIALLTGHLTSKEKKDIYEKLQLGEIDVVVGTHAIIQEGVQFKNLGLVVADEQHRFGVNQRKKLSEKGSKVDFLTMSATPIPRTLAMILYGDKDVSMIRHKPGERKKTITRVVQTRSMKPILAQFESYIQKGGQCYVVCPLIEENEGYNLHSAIKIYEGMMKYYKNRYKIGLLHGRMDDKQKDAVMEQFIAHELDILVCTTVIEVGVDVRNANMMVIYDAHRFGLSQLHQLRGRVGRGDEESYCFLFTDSRDPDALSRLRILEDNDDGFDIANEDLKIRGPGDFLGQRQSGLPAFLIADVMKDFPVLQRAREDAMEIIDKIEEPQYHYLLNFIKNKIKNNDTYVD